MAEKPPQTYSNHARRDPPFHFFLLPVFAIHFLVSVVALIRAPALATAWMAVVALAAVAAVFKIRLYALRVQDRLIRLEERLRLTQLVGEPLRSRIGELSEGQLVALRFAADTEIPGLVEKVLAGKIDRKQIKASIVHWRPDYFRV